MAGGGKHPRKALRPSQQGPGAGALERNALPGGVGPDNSGFFSGILLELRAAGAPPRPVLLRRETSAQCIMGARLVSGSSEARMAVKGPIYVALALIALAFVVFVLNHQTIIVLALAAKLFLGDSAG